MGNIIVYFSLCCDWELLPRDRSGLSSCEALAHLPRKLDAHSEAALEYALRLKDEAALQGQAVQVCAVTAERELSSVLTQNLFAVGADRILTLDWDSEPAFSPSAVACALTEFVRTQSWDLILTGHQDSTSCDSVLPVILSRALSVPYLGPLSDLSFKEDGLHLTRTMPDHTQTAVVQGHAVCALGNSAHPYLRMATLREKLAVMGRQAEHITCSAAGRNAALLQLSPRAAHRNLTWLPGETPTEKASALLSILSDDKGENSL